MTQKSGGKTVRRDLDGIYLCGLETSVQDLSEIEKYFPEQYQAWDLAQSSSEHYKFLAYLGKQLSNATLIDAGTREGVSALALGLNRKNEVISYDIRKVSPELCGEYPNISFKQLDVNEEQPDLLNSAELILLDIDPHDGIQEAKFLDTLRRINYQGIVIMDDIHLNPAMENLWQGLSLPRYDVTAWAHWSGTGVIDFSHSSSKINVCALCASGSLHD